MDKTRLELLQEAVEAEPANAFLRYGLAMELKNAGKLEEAWRHFEFLLNNHADYSATYFHAASVLLELGKPGPARQVIEKGIEVTGQQGNEHARSELAALLEGIE